MFVINKAKTILKLPIIEVKCRTLTTESKAKRIMDCYHDHDTPDDHQLEGQPVSTEGGDLTEVECANYCSQDYGCNGFYL